MALSLVAFPKENPTGNKVIDGKQEGISVRLGEVLHFLLLGALVMFWVWIQPLPRTNFPRH